MHNIAYAEKIIDESPLSNYVVIDKGYDSKNFRTQIQNKDVMLFIPRQKNRE